jgi:hypothetical protein
MEVRTLNVPAQLLEADPSTKGYVVEGENGEFFSVLLSFSEIEPDVERWHMSIAGQSRVPRWNEVAAIAHRLRPGVTFALYVPPQSWWINIHEHCLHLWQIDDPPLERQMLAERSGQTPS